MRGLVRISLAVPTLILLMSTPSSADGGPPPEGPGVFDAYRNQIARSVPYADERGYNQLLAMQQFLGYDPSWTDEDFDALRKLWEEESNWRAGALNPNSSARGIPQAMGSLYPETMEPGWLEDPEAQIAWGLDYIRRRYGSPSDAWAKWQWREKNDERGGWY